MVAVILFMVTSSSYGKLTSRELGAFQPRPIGPARMGGRITAIAIHPEDPRIFYVGTAGGGLWKTDDLGISFRPVFDKYTMSIGSLAIDPSHPDTIWVGTGEVYVRNTVSIGDGLYRSDDGGKTWKFMGFRDSERIAGIIVHPKESKKVYVCVLGHLWNDHEERGVFMTTDGGKTWSKVLYVDEKTGCADIGIDPQEPDVLYASMWQVRRWPWFFKSGGPGSGFYKSTDGGKTWRKITRGLPDGPLGKIVFDIAPSRPSTLYAIVESRKTALYRSDDMGESWTRVTDKGIFWFRPFYLANIVVDPSDHKRLYNTSLSFAYSTDGGKTWNTGGINPFGGGVHPDQHVLAVRNTNPPVMIVGTDGGVYISYDRGASFEFLNTLPVSQFYHVSVSPHEPYIVCGGLQDNGSWCGPGESLSARGISNSEWFNVGGGDGFYAFIDPTDPDIVFNSWQEGHLQWFHRKTGETRDIRPFPKPGEPKFRFNWNAGIHVSPNNPDRIYIGAQFLFKTEDRGQHWERISPDLTTNNPERLKQGESGGLTRDVTGAENYCTIYSISESPRDENVIWVCTDDGQVHVTTDGGKTWNNVTHNISGVPPETWCSHVEASPHRRETAFLTFDGHRTGDMKTYVLRTDDLGKTWTSLVTENLEGYAHVIKQDPVNPDLLYLGTEFGLFISIDSGKTWAHLTENFPRVAVRDMAFHPKRHDLVIATHGRGIWILDDLTPLRALTNEILAQPASVLPSRPAFIRNPAYLQEFPGNGTYYGENPPGGVTIYYYLKKRHLFGKMMIEIVDANGKVIKTLPTTKRKGINRITWNMRLKPPQAPRTTGLSARFAFGPFVSEGTYTVRLVKGKDVFENTITLKPDPRLPYTKEERTRRHELVMKLYSMAEDTAYFGDALLRLMKDIEKRQHQTRSRSLKKRLKQAYAQLKKLREELMSEGFLSEAKLADHVFELYSSVTGYLGPPTEAQEHYYEFLKVEMDAYKRKFNRITKRVIKELNPRLKRAHLKPVKLLTREEVRQKRGGAISKKAFYIMSQGFTSLF